MSGTKIISSVFKGFGRFPVSRHFPKVGDDEREGRKDLQTDDSHNKNKTPPTSRKRMRTLGEPSRKSRRCGRKTKGLKPCQRRLNWRSVRSKTRKRRSGERQQGNEERPEK